MKTDFYEVNFKKRQVLVSLAIFFNNNSGGGGGGGRLYFVNTSRGNKLYMRSETVFPHNLPFSLQLKRTA